MSVKASTKLSLVKWAGILAAVLSTLGVQAAQAGAKTSQESVKPGTSVFAKGKELRLHEGTIAVGEDFGPFAKLLGIEVGSPMVISVVPSIDTKVCEEQSHLMGESPDLKTEAKRYVVSRDTPMAQTRFQKEAKLENVTFVSDFVGASFGKKAGLLIQESELLARAVLVIDKDGKIRHLQIVKTITELPDMAVAFAAANELLGEKKSHSN